MKPAPEFRFFRLIIVTLMFSSQLALSQTRPKIKTLNNSSGLSQNSAYDIIQDKQGFLWIATENGLNRYDGKKFETFQHRIRDPHSLSNNFILQLFEDEKGRIWCATNGNGLSRLDKNTERFTHFADSSDKTKLYVNNAIWSICGGKSGDLWLGTFGGGLKHIDQNGKALGRFTTKDGLAGMDVRSVVSDKTGNIWIGCFDGGLAVKRNNTKGIISFKTGNVPKKILRLYNDELHNCIWIATHEQGLFCFNKRTGSFINFLTPTDHIRDIITDPFNKDLLWLASWGKGIIRFNIKTGRCENFGRNELDPVNASDNLILSLQADKSGLIWAGTYNNGLSQVSIFPEKFRTINVLGSQEKGTNNVIYSVAQQDNTLWIGTHGKGIHRYDLNTGEQQAISPPDNEVVYSILPDGNELWYGTGNGLYRKDLRTGTHKIYLPDSTRPNSISYESITAILKVNQEIYWFGSYGGGLNRFDPKTGKFKVFTNIPGDKQSLPENTVYCLFEDRDKRLWIGTGKGGLCSLKPGSEKFECEKNENLCFGQTIHHIDQDQNGRLWIATPNGLVCMDRTNANDQVRIFTTDDGLPSNYISGILIDRQNNIWTSGNMGISRLSLPTGTHAKASILKFGIEDGIKNIEYLYSSATKGRNGLFYMGSIDGVTVFDPQSIKLRTSNPQIVITGFSIFNHPVGLAPNTSGLQGSGKAYTLPQAISNTKEIELSYRESVFSFHFAALDLLSPQKNQYAYKMENFEEDWNFVGNRNNATYTSLPPGKYTFRVRGSNSDGVWGTNEARIRIVVLPPWWATWWFRIGTGVIIILTVVMLVRIRINTLKRDRKVLEEKVVERTQEINAQKDQLEVQAGELMVANEKLVEMDAFKENLTTMLVHDLKNPLGSIVNLSSSDRNNEHNQLIENSARQMLNLVMNLLEVQKMKDARIEVNLQQAEVNKLIQEAVSYLSLSAGQKNIEFEVNVPAGAQVICDAHLIERVLINLLANAIYYSPQNSKVEISVKNAEEPGKLRFSVLDHGKGISPEKVATLFSEENKPDRKSDKYSTGIGLQYCQWALAAHQCNVNVMSKLGAGSEFYFYLPNVGALLPTENEMNTINIPLLLTENEIELLHSSASFLKSMRVYEGGKILTHLKDLPETTENIIQWKQELKKAVYSINEPYYKQLLNLVETP